MQESNLQNKFKHFAPVMWAMLPEISILTIYTLGWHSSEDTGQNVKNALLGSLVFSIAFGFISNNKEMYKKNDLISKVLSNICLAYCLFLVFLYFMNFEDARKIIRLFQEDISEEKLKESYIAWDLDCSLSAQDF